MASALEEIVAPAQKPMIRTLAAFAAIVGGLLLVSDRAAAFVDERIKNKTVATDKLIELQTRQLEKMEGRLDEMRTQIGEIKVEIVTVRELMQKQAK